MSLCNGWPKGSTCTRTATWRFWYSADGTAYATAWRLCDECKDAAMATPRPPLKPYCSRLRLHEKLYDESSPSGERSMTVSDLDVCLRHHKIYRVTAMCVGQSWVLTAHRLGGETIPVTESDLIEALNRLCKYLEGT